MEQFCIKIIRNTLILFNIKFMIIWIKYRWFDYSRDINLVTGLITVRDVFRRKIDRREVEQFKGRGV